MEKEQLTREELSIVFTALMRLQDKEFKEGKTTLMFPSETSKLYQKVGRMMTEMDNMKRLAK
jgi:hypothetical protein